MQQPIQRARAGRQQTSPQITVQPPMILFIGRQPFGQERLHPPTARLQRRKPDRLEHRQQCVGKIFPRPSQNQSRRGFDFWCGAQRTNGRLAMITKQLNGAVEQLGFIFCASLGVSTPPFGQHFLLRFLTHFVVHVG
jgi:hypothetical protein